MRRWDNLCGHSSWVSFVCVSFELLIVSTTCIARGVCHCGVYPAAHWWPSEMKEEEGKHLDAEQADVCAGNSQCGMVLKYK